MNKLRVELTPSQAAAVSGLIRETLRRFEVRVQDTGVKSSTESAFLLQLAEANMAIESAVSVSVSVK